MSVEFADTNVVLYLLDDGPKADRAEDILGQGPRISVQVLNEAMVNCRRKAGLSWEETGAFLAGVQSLCPVEDRLCKPILWAELWQKNTSCLSMTR